MLRIICKNFLSQTTWSLGRRDLGTTNSKNFRRTHWFYSGLASFRLAHRLTNQNRLANKPSILIGQRGWPTFIATHVQKLPSGLRWPLDLPMNNMDYLPGTSHVTFPIWRPLMQRLPNNQHLHQIFPLWLGLTTSLGHML